MVLIRSSRIGDKQKEKINEEVEEDAEAEVEDVVEVVVVDAVAEEFKIELDSTISLSKKWQKRIHQLILLRKIQKKSM